MNSVFRCSLFGILTEQGGSELVGTGWKWEGGRSEACCRKLGSLERCGSTTKPLQIPSMQWVPWPGVRNI